MTSNRNSRTRSRGVVLPIVLLLSSMLLVTAAAWFEMDLARARATANSMDRVVAFHAADSALNRCSQSAADLFTDEKSRSGPLGAEPANWRLKSSFEGASALALTPFASWPQTARPPQCLIEAWPAQTRGNASAFLVTARGFGRSKASEVWLQQQVSASEASWSGHWRRVVARPFQGASE